MFRQIAASESTSCAALRECSPLTPATLSHHLKELEAAGLIETTRSGKFVHASVHRPTWQAFLAGLKAI